MNERNEDSYFFDDVVVDRAGLRVHKGGRTLKLTPRAFAVLVYLAEHRGRILEKQELFEQIWKETFVTDNALTRVIKEIRQALGDSANSPRYIETVPRHGYRFIAEVNRPIEDNPQPPKVITGCFQETVDIRPESSVLLRKEEDPADLFGGDRAGYKQIGGSVAAIFFSVAMIAALVVWGNGLKPEHKEPIRALRTMQVTTWAGLDIYPAISPDGNAVAYSSDHNGNFEIYVKPLTPEAREIQLTTDSKQNFQPTWSPDGKRIAYHSKGRGGIWVVPSSGGTAKQLTEFGSDPAWSPDGSRIAFQSYPLTDLDATSIGGLPPSTLWLVSSQGGDATPVTQVGNPAGGHGEPSWSPDGKRIIFIAAQIGSGEIWSITAAGTGMKQVAHLRDWVYDPIYSADGEQIFFGGVSEPGNFVLYRLRISPANSEAIGEPEEIANTGLARVKHLSISTDRKRLVYSTLTMKGSIASVPISPISNEAVGVPSPLTQDTSYRKSIPRFSPDGTRIAYIDRRGGVRSDIWVMDADGKNPLQLTTDPQTDWTPSWFPDNEQIAFQTERQGKSSIWTLSTKSGREKFLLAPAQDMGWPTVSPDGKQLAFNSTKSGTINIWKVAVEGGEPAQLTFDKEMMGWPCWSPDGKLLAFQMRRGDDTQVMVMPSDGGAPTQLTSDCGQSWAHSWSPDGDKIAFAGFRNGSWNVWWVSRSTKQQKQVTHYTKLNAYVRYPTWSPLGDRIVYEYAETTGNIWLMELP